MTQTTEERIAAIASLLPLCESHLEHHGQIVSRAQWVSPPEPPPPGWVPPPPETDCFLRCTLCIDFRTQRCVVREFRWAQEWRRLRQAYPQLASLEMLVWSLGHHQALWAAAVRYQYLQPWAEWNPVQRGAWARAGVEWIEERLEGWIPTHVEQVVVKPKVDRVEEAGRLRADGCSHDQIRRELHMRKKDVPALLSAFAKRNGSR